MRRGYSCFVAISKQADFELVSDARVLPIDNAEHTGAVYGQGHTYCAAVERDAAPVAVFTELEIIGFGV